ncbi:MAG: COX15/CtaA family protein [bacterium]
MPTIRRFSYAAFLVACTHLVFGAIVRISGSGMGCGDHWPKCYGYWFPPLSRPDLIIEVSHRYLASILLLTLIALLVAAWRRKDEAGVGGRGGVLRSAGLAVTLGFSAAILGAVTVKLGNAPFATVAHWTVAMSLVATAAASVIRAGGLGGLAARGGGATARTRRATFAAAAMALIAVVMGGLTAKFPGAAVACQKFPLCGPNPDVLPGAVYVQLTHRTIALLLILHLFGLLMAQRKRQEAAVVRRALLVAFSLGITQLLIAGAMIGMHLPPVLRSLHEAAGVSIWITTFVLAYLARIASDGAAVSLVAVSPTVPAARVDDAVEGVIRVPASQKHAFASAVEERVLLAATEPAAAWQGDAERGAGIDQLLAEASPVFVAASEELSVTEAVVVADVEVVEVVEVAAVIAPTATVPAVVDVAIRVTPAAVEPAVVDVAIAALVAPDIAVHDAMVSEVAAIHAPDSIVVEAPAEGAGPATTAHIDEAIEKLAELTSTRSTMTHSVAVIVARGADL